MAWALFFHLALRKFIEIRNNKPIFSQYNIFYKYKHFFLNLCFDLLTIIAKKFNQISNNEVCVGAHLVFVFLMQSLRVLVMFFNNFQQFSLIRLYRSVMAHISRLCYFLWLWFFIRLWLLHLLNTSNPLCVGKKFRLFKKNLLNAFSRKVMWEKER